jgi:hypothetical protein
MNGILKRILCSCCLAVLGCAVNQQGVNSKINTESSRVFPEKFKIRFISYGTGIDYRQKEILDSIIGHYTTVCQIAYSKKSWGREGEIDYCFNQLDRDCEKIFYTDLINNMAFKERVLLEKGAGCERNIERIGNRR